MIDEIRNQFPGELLGEAMEYLYAKILKRDVVRAVNRAVEEITD